MKNLKKVLALVLACATLFTMSSFAFSDVAEDASYLEAVTMLSKLGIINGYEDGTFLPDNTITRAEAAKVLVCALNAEDSAKGMADQALFTDVPSTHWAAGYVNYAANYGIIAGRGNGIFDPESPVSYEEIVKMVVAMLGYTPVANIKGGYPTGYIYVANNVAKITKGATGLTGDAAKRWVVARLVFNSLETKIMEPEKWSASDPDYIKGEDTLLKDYLEVTKVEGILKSTFLSEDNFQDKEDQNVTIHLNTINGKSKRALEDDGDGDWADKIDTDYTVDANDTYAEDYLGYTVTAYVRDFDEGSDELVAIAPKANKNSALDVAFDDFGSDDVKISSNKVQFEYYASVDADDTTTGKVNVKKDVPVFKNGKYDNDYAADDVVDLIQGYVDAANDNIIDTKDKEGFIRFLDNDGDGYADYLFVETINAEYVVDSITAKSYKIKDKKDDKTITLDPTDDEKYVNFYKNGVQVEFSAIKKGDTLSVAYNKGTRLNDASVVNVYISSETVEGYVSTASANKNEYKIDGTVYAKSFNYDKAISRTDDGVFYLNYKNRIAYKEAETTKEGNYAFVLDINNDDSFSDGISYTLRFMNEKGEWVDAKLYDKLAIYGSDGGTIVKYSNVDEMNGTDSKSKKATIAAATLKWLNLDGTDLKLDVAKEQRVFKYTLNSNGDITKITLPILNDGNDNYDKWADTVDEDNFAGEAFTATYKESSNRFNGITYKGGADKNTVIFKVDIDDTETIKDVTKKADVSLSTYAMFKDDTDYKGFAYDYGTDSYKCMVITNAGKKIDEESSLVVVKSAEIVSDGNDEYLTIDGYMDGKEVTLESVVADDVDITSNDKTTTANITTAEGLEAVECGAIIEVSLDGAGKVDSINVLFTFEEAVYGDTVDNGNHEDGAAYLFGAIVSDKATGSGKAIDLAEKYNGTVIENIATAGAGMKGNIYYVKNGARKNAISVDTSIADYVDSIDDSTGSGDTVYLAFAKLYDGDTVDVVVYDYEIK